MQIAFIKRIGKKNVRLESVIYRLDASDNWHGCEDAIADAIKQPRVEIEGLADFKNGLRVEIERLGCLLDRVNELEQKCEST